MLPKTFSPTPILPHLQTHAHHIYAFQFETMKPFKSVDELKSTFLNAFRIQHSLPHFSSISATTIDKNTKEPSKFHFKIIFSCQNFLTAWTKAIEAATGHFKNQQIIDFYNPKVILKGILESLASKANFNKTICTYLNSSEVHCKFLFSQKSDSNDPNMVNSVFAVSPEIRVKLRELGDNLILDQHQIAVEILDFYQPLQCSKCYKLGHSSTKCRTNVSCQQCSATNCAIKEPEHCPNKRCINCFQTDHTAKERSRCPEYTSRTQQAKARISEILKNTSPLDVKAISTKDTEFPSLQQTMQHKVVKHNRLCDQENDATPNKDQTFNNQSIQDTTQTST